MRLPGLFRLLGKSTPTATHVGSRYQTRLRIEQFESRLVPYAITSNAWPAPQLVTLSFVPDGTLMTTGINGNVYSNLFATFNAKFGSTATWENEILKAAQSWAAQANINLSIIADNGTPSGQGNYQQGDSGMGDIRIGGYGFSTRYLAGTYLPPSANNYSIAGDMNFNTNMAFNVGTTYDLQTVALHEFGHAFGMGHSAFTTAAMYPSYNGKKQALSADDVTGIQGIYGARQPDVYNTGILSNSTFATAASVGSLLDPVALSAVINNLDVVSPSGAEYFTVAAPLTTSGTLSVDVQSSGLSLLTPAVTVYAADQVTVLGSATGAGLQNGANLAVTISGITAGQQFYIQVTGADTTQFSTGDYALSLNFGTGLMPTVSLPNTQLLNGTPLTGGGALALAVADMLAVSDDVSGDSSFGAAGFPHGSGCGCPMCRGAASANPIVATAEPLPQNPAKVGLPLITLNPWDSLSQGSSSPSGQPSDAYFAHGHDSDDFSLLADLDR
jgi:hypothetical protein